MIKKLLGTYKSKGATGLIRNIYRRAFPLRAVCFSTCRRLLAGRRGLEIGGPSNVFYRKTGVLPIYPIVEGLDNCNFSNTTTWEKEISAGRTFRFDENRELGTQYINEATDLSAIASSTHDFVLSSHVLEHIANPLLALNEWSRVLKDDGTMVLILPERHGTFDHKRGVTSLEHLIEDFEAGTKEDDLTHLPEILKLHDLSRDPEAGSFPEFKVRSEKNAENRCLHHHVFDQELLSGILRHVNFEVHSLENVPPFHIIAIAQKLPSQ